VWFSIALIFFFSFRWNWNVVLKLPFEMGLSFFPSAEGASSRPLPWETSANPKTDHIKHKAEEKEPPKAESKKHCEH